MDFGHPFIAPPLLYYCFYPQYVLPLDTLPNLAEHCSLVAPGLECQEEGHRIVLTKEDLLEEGYEQTKKAWTEEEDKILMKLCSRSNKSFDEVAMHLAGRNSKMCYSRFRRLTNQSKQNWSKAENEKLSSLVEKHAFAWKEFLPYFLGTIQLIQGGTSSS